MSRFPRNAIVVAEVIITGKVKPGEKEENVALPEELVKRVENYRFERKLSNKKDAYRELLEKGLMVAENEKPGAPKS